MQFLNLQFGERTTQNRNQKGVKGGKIFSIFLFFHYSRGLLNFTYVWLSASTNTWSEFQEFNLLIRFWQYFYQFLSLSSSLSLYLILTNFSADFLKFILSHVFELRNWHFKYVLRFAMAKVNDNCRKFLQTFIFIHEVQKI